MTEINLTTEFGNTNFNKACRAVRSRRNQKAGFWQGWGGWIICALGLGVLAGIVSALVGGKLGATLVYVIIFGGLCGLIMLWSKRAQNVIKEAPIRIGPTQIMLRPDGYASAHPGYEAFIKWSHIPGVIVTPQALLILHSDLEFYPIEADAFEDADHMQRVADQITEWIEMAKA